jgi:hypothetical protein
MMKFSASGLTYRRPPGGSRSNFGGIPEIAVTKVRASKGCLSILLLSEIFGKQLAGFTHCTNIYEACTKGRHIRSHLE